MSPFDAERYARILKGLQAAEVKFSDCKDNPDFRIDAEFYESLPAESSYFKWEPIGKHLLKSEYGISIEMNEEDKGFPIYRMNEIEDMLCIWDIAKSAAISRSEAEIYFLKPRDVLFNRTNSQKFVGRTGLYLPFTNEQRVFASYLVRLVPDEKSLLPEYLVAYLNSSRGIRDIKRRARISINQSNVNPEEVKAIRIPLLSNKLQLRIKDAFDIAHKNQKTAAVIMTEAETLLINTLGLRGWYPPEPLSYSRRASEAFATGRLDAELFQPKYDALRTKLKQAAPLSPLYSFGKEILNDFVPVDSENYYYTEISDITIGDGAVAANELLGNELPANAKVILNGGELLVSKVRPTRGAVGIAPEGPLSNHVASGAFFVLCVPSLAREYLQVFLRSMPGRLLLEERCKGSSYPVLDDVDIRNVSVPAVSSVIMEKMRDYVNTAHAARQRAHALLAAAKRVVEIAIEDSEIAALAYLKSEESNYANE